MKGPAAENLGPRSGGGGRDASSRRGWKFGASLAAGVGGLALLLTACAPVAPPSPDLSSTDPALATLINTARTAVVRAPKSAAAWGQLGQALHATEFHAGARTCYSNAAALDPKAFRWPYLLGLLELQDQPEAALQHLARASELAAGQSAAPRYQLARALVERGQFDQAAPHLELLLAAQPQHAAAHLELARVQLSRQALREATRELQPALTNSYTMRAAFLLAAQIAQRNGQTDLAGQFTRHAAALPRPFDWPDAIQREVQGLRSDPAHLADLVNACLQQQRLPEAEAGLAKLLNAFPNDTAALLLLGRLRYLQKNCPEAEKILRLHLTAQPDSLNGLIQLGLTLLCEEQWTNAAAALERAVALKPDFAVAHSNLGLARSRAGDAAGAIRAYRDALRCTPGDLNTHLALAEELANAGLIEEARRHIESAAALSPNDRRVQQARTQLGVKP